MGLNLTDVRNTFSHAQALISANVMVSVLTATEPDADLYLVAVLEELAGKTDLYSQVVVVGLWTNLKFFELGGLTTGLRLRTFTFVLNLSVVSDSANRRVRVGRNFHQVQTAVTSQLACVIRQEFA
ncbi:MAG: hypothetical protein ACJAZO_005022 [Myxococcota bacterium]|jgi:hypothetical protein